MQRHREVHHRMRSKPVGLAAAAALVASSLALVLSGTALAAASATPPATTVVPPNGVATAVVLSTVSSSSAADLATGSLSITLPAGFSWATPPTLTATNATFTGSAPSWTVTAVSPNWSLAFAGGTVTTSTRGANGNVTLSNTGFGSLVVAMLRTTGAQGGQGKSHGARKAALFQNPSFTCPTGAQPTAGASRYGFVVLNSAGKGMLNVTISLKGGTPNTTYDVWVNQNPGACPLGAATKTGALKTNGKGNGNAHLRIPLVAGATGFWASVVNPSSGSDVFRSPAVNLSLKHPHGHSHH